MNPHLWWYVARASGLVAWLLLSASMLWGLFVTTRLLGTKPTPAWLLDLHRFLGGLSVLFTGTHLLGLALDSYVHFGLSELFVPLASRWHPVAVAWGVIALYVLVAVEGSSLLMKRLPRNLWRAIHRLSFVLFVTATAHVLFAGTDTKHRTWAWATAMSITLAIAWLWGVAHQRAKQKAENAKRLKEQHQANRTAVPVPAP